MDRHRCETQDYASAMSETQQGAGWWQASDGKWYAPELHPNYVAPTASSPTGDASPAAGLAADEAPQALAPGGTAAHGATATAASAVPGGYVGGPVGYVGSPTAPRVGPPPGGGYGYTAGGFQPNLAAARYSGLAIASLVLSIIWLGGIGAILA